MEFNELGAGLMILSGIVVIGCLTISFLMERAATLPWLILIHGIAMVGAVGITIGYIMRRESQSRSNI